MCNSSQAVSIHVLDDDSLLHVFYLYRPFLLGEDLDEDAHMWGGDEGWQRGRWWYKLAHVCQRWRKVILRSASYLGVSLVCTNGTRVADMLAHSPPLPLAIDYRFRYFPVMAEDEKGITLALEQHHRVHRVRLQMPITTLPKFIIAMDDEYPILEYLIIDLRIDDISLDTFLVLPEALQAPHLRHLTLVGFALPIGSRLLTTARLMTLCLVMTHPSTYFHPHTLLQWLSLMPELETLLISHVSSVSNHDVEGQLTHTPIITPVTLPNLRRFTFQGASTFLEAIVHWIITPRLEQLEAIFFLQLTFSVPYLLQFINTTESLRFDSALLNFTDEGVTVAFPLCDSEESEIYAVGILVQYWRLDWQVSSMAQISNSLSSVFSAVEHLTLQHNIDNSFSEEYDEVDRRTEWRKLLSSFKNVKTLRIDTGINKELSRCLELNGGELPLEMLPELQELTYSGSDNAADASSFVSACQKADRSITLVRRSPSPSPDPSSSVTISQASKEAGSDRDI